MTVEHVIYVVVNAEDTQGVPNLANALGGRDVCDAHIAAQADMMYASLCQQAEQLDPGARIVMHQGGGRNFRLQLGSGRLVAAGRIKSKVRPLTAADAANYPGLWAVTSRWYKKWPGTPGGISGEQIIFYDLKKAKAAMPTPITPMRGNKFIALHPNCTLHHRCSAYAHVRAWWEKVMSEP